MDKRNLAFLMKKIFTIQDEPELPAIGDFEPTVNPEMVRDAQENEQRNKVFVYVTIASSKRPS